MSGARRGAPTITSVIRRTSLVQLAMLGLVSVLVVTAVFGYRAAVERAARSARLLDRVDVLLTEVLNAETSVRGYGLVGRLEFLEPYRAAIPAIEDELQAIERAGYRGDPRVAGIRRVVRAWRADLATPVIRAVAEGRQQDALDRFASGVGKRRIDEVRRLAGDLADDVRDEGSRFDRQAEVLGVAAVVVAIVAVLGAVGIGLLLRRRLHRQVAAPIAGLADAAQRLGDGDLGARAEGHAEGVADIEQVARSFNAMATSMERTVTELRSLDRMKSEFVSVVSHELRTPLTSIRGSLGLLSAGAFGPVPAEAGSMLDIALTNTDRLIRLINDILDLERIDSGRAALDLRRCAVGPLVQEAADAVAGVAGAAGVTVEVHPVDVELVADCDRVVQCLTNLLGNAVKFSPPGGRVVIDGERLPGEVALRVRDEGRGIPADKVDAIFERFGQVDATDAREKGGTGLGLAIVRTIVEQHGGSVGVESEPGAGTTFTLRFPVDRRSSPVDRRPADEASAEAAPPLPDRDQQVVLLVEDDRDLVEILRAQLGRHGLQVVTAAGAGEAIRLGLLVKPDLLVLDVRLAEGDAYEVVRALRADDRLRSVPTVVFTVHDLDRAARDRLRLGETVFVSKGVDADTRFEAEVLGLLARLPGTVRPS